MSLFDSLKNLANKVFGAAKDAAVEAKEVTSGLVDEAKTSYQTGGVKGVVNKAGEELSEAGTQLQSIVTTAAQTVKEAYDEQGGVQGVLTKASEEAKELADKAVQSAKSVADKAMGKANELKDDAQETLTKVTDEATTVAKKTVSRAKKTADQALDKASEIKDKVLKEDAQA